MELQEVKEWLGADWTGVQEYISRALGSDIDLLNKVNASILSNSGKQLRPVLALLVAKACSGGSVTDDTLRYAAAAELLHNATLLHDDVADQSDQRRGKPTVNSLMGSRASVLVGDFWLVRAVNLILGSSSLSNRVIRIFSKTLSDLAEGEMLQLQKAESGDTNEADYLRIIYNKTASLFEASVLSAAISVNASEKMCKAVTDFAVNLGLAFQIRDDIFDYSLGMNVGKPVGADILEGKITMPLLGAFANVSAERELCVRTMIRSISDTPQARETICEFVRNNGGVEYAQRSLGTFTRKALDSLELLPQSQSRDILEAMVEYVGERKI